MTLIWSWVYSHIAFPAPIFSHPSTRCLGVALVQESAAVPARNACLLLVLGSIIWQADTLGGKGTCFMGVDLQLQLVL